MQRRENTFVNIITASVHKTRPHLAKGELWLGIFAVFFALFAVISPKTTEKCVSETLSFFGRSILPSMFPFMIASGLLTSCGIGRICKKLFSPLFYRVFGISGSLAPAFILGWLAGAPMGAKMICELYRQGECSADEAEKALPLCSNPGLGFTVVVIGDGMIGSTVIGLMLWLTCGASSIITAILINRRQGHALTEKNTAHSKHKQAEDLTEVDNDRPISRMITDTVIETVHALLKICGFIVFFKTASVFFLEITASFPFFSHFIANSSMSKLTAAAITAFMEFSTGARLMSEAVRDAFAFTLPRLIPKLTSVFTAAILSWSGMSVHFQTTSFASDSGLKMRRYYRSKAISATVSAIITTVWCTFLSL